MASEVRAEQDREWAILYDQIKSVLLQYGEADDGAQQKDFLLVDENLGLYRHRVETNKLHSCNPSWSSRCRSCSRDIRIGRS
jgi:hypothetical protein